jgi:hypothetical protein
MVAKMSATSKIVLLSGSLLFPALHLCSQEREAIVIRDVQHGISAPLRDIRDTPVAELEADRDEMQDQDREQGQDKVLKSGSQVAHVPAYDPALQTELVASKLTQGKRIQGLGSTGRVVPDANGAAGATQYMQWVNSGFAIYLKATGALVLSGRGNKFWSGLTGPCESTNPNDGVILYDKLAQRWVVSHYAGSGPYVQCVAVSTTTDATGSYYQYAFTLPSSYFPDYGKISSWPDAYYLSVNLLNQNNSFIPEGGTVCALERANMLAGKSATAQCFTTSVKYMSLLPADLDGTTAPPAGSPNYLLDLGTNALELWKFHVDWVTPSNSTLTGPTSIAVAKYTEACSGGVCIPQPPPATGTSSLLDSLADRLMHRLEYRNFGTHESIVAVHSVDPPTNAWSGIRWYEIRNPAGTPTVYQQGTFSPDQQSRWMPSIAMDKNNDIVVGYSVSSNLVNPSIRYTGRLSTDTLGTLETESNVVIGDGVQTLTDRWGDYSGMSVDPADDCTFWYTNQYLPTTGNSNWATFIVSFKFPSCP